MLAENGSHASDDSYLIFHRWTFSDFTPWAFVSAFLWVPGGTAGVYAIRHAGLAISVGIWSCVIVILSYVWGVWIFGEEQKSVWGAVRSVAVLCVGLCGSAYFSSREVDQDEKEENSAATEHTSLVRQSDYSQQAIDFHEIALSSKCNKHTYQMSKYHAGLCMAVINGILASTIMVPLHYAPAATTSSLGYSMSFGVAAVLAVMLFWMLRFVWLTSINYYSSLMHWVDESRQQIPSLEMLLRIKLDALNKGYQQLPSFHLRVMWRAGMTSGVLYSMGNLFGIISIKKLGDFMGYSLNQSSVIISGKIDYVRHAACYSITILTIVLKFRDMGVVLLSRSTRCCEYDRIFCFNLCCILGDFDDGWSEDGTFIV
jgi:riboflavin transporter FmnP